jgi:hypothetical protein
MNSFEYLNAVNPSHISDVKDMFTPRKPDCNVFNCLLLFRIMIIPTTTASAEMSLSRLKLIKTQGNSDRPLLRNAYVDSPLLRLTMSVASAIEHSDIFNEFSSRKIIRIFYGRVKIVCYITNLSDRRSSLTGTMKLGSRYIHLCAEVSMPLLRWVMYWQWVKQSHETGFI